MDTIVTRSARRLWRLFTRNALVRTSDRVESVVSILAVALVLLALPLAGAIGTAVHDSHSADYQEQVRTATPGGDGARRQPSTVRPYAVSFDVHARWYDHGIAHEDVFGWDRPPVSVRSSRSGSTRRGDYTGPPIPRGGRPAMACSGAVLWLSVLTVVASVTGLVRFPRIERRSMPSGTGGYARWSVTTWGAPVPSTDLTGSAGSFPV